MSDGQDRHSSVQEDVSVTNDGAVDQISTGAVSRQEHGEGHSEDGRQAGYHEPDAQEKSPVGPDRSAAARRDVAETSQIGGAENLKDENDPTSASELARARDIEKEASEHLARRAAEMNIADEDSGQRAEFEKSTAATLPDTPPPPAPPRKDNVPSADRGQEYNGKQPLDEGSRSDVPELPQGTTEVTGEEIQTIMDQFQNGGGAIGEQEIMSPRFERQKPVLMLPPRSSSLEPRDSYTISPQTTGQSISSQHSHRQTTRPSSIADGSIHKVKSEDSESLMSAKAGSILQPPPPSPEPEPSLPFDFHRFLEQLRHRTADPVARFLRSFLVEFGKKQWMVHEQVKIISDFLEFISKRMAQCEVWRTVSDAEFDNAREGMEKLVMNRLYSQTFSPAIPAASGSPRKGGKSTRSQADVANPHGPGRRGQHQEDVERDEVIAQKLRIYGWISEEHLDIQAIGDKGRKFLSLAQQELLKINTYRAPRDKVICVLNCCKVIFGYLKNTKSDQSADAFVPLLIYTVLRARPEHVVSNVQYIWRFRNQDKLGGEAGYYMSSLMGVVSFIENLDRTNLTISDEEFEHNVEQAVSAIAEKNKEEENETKAHSTATAAPMQHLSEKSALSRPEVTPRNSMEAERSSPRRNVSQRLVERNHQGQRDPQSPVSDDDDTDAVTGLLKTIQKPLSSIGRMFSDDNRAAVTSQPTSTPRGLSPAPKIDRKLSAEFVQQRRSTERQISAQREESAARQASAEAAQAEILQRRDYAVVVE